MEYVCVYIYEVMHCGSIWDGWEEHFCQMGGQLWKESRLILGENTYKKWGSGKMSHLKRSRSLSALEALMCAQVNVCLCLKTTALVPLPH